MHTLIHATEYICVHTSIRVYTYTNLYVCVHTSIRVYTYTNLYKCILAPREGGVRGDSKSRPR